MRERMCEVVNMVGLFDFCECGEIELDFVFEFEVVVIVIFINMKGRLDIKVGCNIVIIWLIIS